MVKHILGVMAIAFLMAAPAGATTLLHYTFQDGSGTTVTDQSGQMNHGTMNGFASTAAGAGVFGVSEGWVTGGGVSTLTGDGNRSFVETPLELNDLTGDFTLEIVGNVVANMTDFQPGVGSSFDGPGFDPGEAIFFGLDADSFNLHARTPNDDGKDLGFHPWGPFPDATKHHIAFVYDSGSGMAEIFANGVSLGTQPFTNTAMAEVGDGVTFRISGTGWAAGETWNGILFAVAISDTKLDPSDFVTGIR